MLGVTLLDNRTPDLIVMLDKARDLKISLIVLGHLHCTHRTATHLIKKPQLRLEELGDRYGGLRVTTD